MMTSAQVVKTSVTVTDNSPFQDYPHPDDHTTQSTETVIPGKFDVICVSSANIVSDVHVPLLTVSMGQVGPAHIPKVGSKPAHAYLGKVGDDFI